MKLFIPKDIFDNPKPPRLFLCTTDKKIINELPSYDETLDGKWGTYSETQFSIDRQYVDVLTGEVKIHPTFDKAEGLRKVYMEGIGYFVIQDPSTNYGEKDSKTLSCFSSEYETANKYLENFRINTGEIDSKEVIALETEHGYNYTIDQNNLYKLASGEYDPYQSYYIMDYTDNDSYTYKQIQVEEDVYLEYIQKNQDTSSQKHERLYIKNYPNVRFYWPTRPELSFLHLVFGKIPEWKIGNVDVALWRKERKFDEDRVAVYDFLMNTVQDTFKCVIEWDTITNEVNFYEEADDGITDDDTVQTRWETDVFVSRDNLTNEININYSTDDIKTKLKISGADGLDVREVNLGRNYIMNLGYYHNHDWMGQELCERYDDYLEAVKEYTPQYTDAMQNWVAANNKWNDLMNAVPADGNVVLVGDPFKKLYCTYAPIDTAYCPEEFDKEADHRTTFDNITLYKNYDAEKDEYTDPIDPVALRHMDAFIVQGCGLVYLKENSFIYLNLYNKATLIEKLTLLHVNEDVNAIDPTNILLRLNNKNSDTATLRVYNASGNKNSPEYMIKCVKTSADTGSTSDMYYSLDDWLDDGLTADKLGLEGFKVQYIGTAGAYLVLAKDERVEHNLEDYGVRMLQEKHKVYTSIFTTQTEKMYSQEGYKCIAYDVDPVKGLSIDVTENTIWLDTNSSPPQLYKYTNDDWIKFSDNVSRYEDYQRYIENYEKLQTVQTVLVEKETQAQYLLDGFKVENQRIYFDLYKPDSSGILKRDEQTLEGDMKRVAEAHIHQYGKHHSVAKHSMDQNVPIFYFTTSYDPIIYSRNTEEFRENAEYYIKLNGTAIYQRVVIEDQTMFDSYDGSTDDKTLYVVTSGNIFAVYLKGNIPYVAYGLSKGVCRAIMDRMTQITDLENFFTEDQWIRLSPFIKEDEFSDSNFLLTGYESEEERIEICKELMDAANKELDTRCQPSLEFSMDMANLLALPEFKPLINQFQLGNFVRVYIRDGYVKRARLLDVHINFSDLSDFSCSFGNLIITKNEIDKHAELLAQAVTAGKQVAVSAGDWQRAVDTSNKLETEIANGLQNATLEVGKASGQAIVWDEFGIWGRKIDEATGEYDKEQFRIINNKLVFSNDGFKTSKAVFGSYTVNGETRWGPLAEYVTADTIEGKFIKGGEIRIGDENKEGGSLFIVHEDGSVEIKSNGTDKYATTSVVNEISQARKYHVELTYSGSTVFSAPGQECEITCHVYKWDEDITKTLENKGVKFQWLKNGQSFQETTQSKITVNSDHIDKNAQISCKIQFDDTGL